MARRSLGRGLSVLLGAEAEEPGLHTRLPKSVPIEYLRPSPLQPRQRFDDEPLQSLAQSIRENGVLQPILVRRREAPNTYEIVAGERRWRAAQIARLHEVPVIVRELSDREAIEFGLVENVQREDLSALEEAAGYRRLADDFGYSQDDMARRVGKSRSHIANTMRLLALPPEVRLLIEEGRLSPGHARALIGAGDPAALAREVVARGLNVRQTERLAQGRRRGRGAVRKDADTALLERELSALLGLKVRIHARGRGGTLSVRYANLEQLDEVLARLGRPLAPAAS